MEQFIIKGPTHLKGDVRVSGAKNAALPIIASTLLIKGEATIQNVPDIKDVRTLLNIIEGLDGRVEFRDNTLMINNTHLSKKNPEPMLVRNLRASILLIAPLLIRNGQVLVPHPGGCLIGSRPMNTHIETLKKMGAKVRNTKAGYILEGELKAASLVADFSVTGTENLIMAAVLTPGTTTIELAAAEPHVQDLCNFLNSCGADIKGVGTHSLRIEGVKKLLGQSHTIIPDQIEAGTFAIALAASKGSGRVFGFVRSHQHSLISKFEQMGVNFKIEDEDTIKIEPTHTLKPTKIKTEIYPGFPTDLQAPFSILATQAAGTTEIYETIFEGRLSYINELSKMGASCIIRDAHQASITGPTPLFGSRITTFDLRAGATLIIAALMAQGESRLDQIEIIDRGYEKIEEKLLSLGANIRRVKLEEVNE
jgi:UDP-N-acetylglucosamine 1-carboxyvinyltransferase